MKRLTLRSTAAAVRATARTISRGRPCCYRTAISTVIDFEGFVDGVAFEGGKGDELST